jgi:hypothetical protein
MRIIDSTIFYNEFDLLELRLSEYYDHVDRFVIVESDRSFTGIYKGYNLEKHFDRYSKWADKIVYIKVVHPNQGGNAWQYEEWQRDQMTLGWSDCGADDVILVSDVDEIVRPEALQFIRNTNYDFYGLYMPAFYFKFNYMDAKPDWHYKVWGRAYRGIRLQQPHKMRYTNSIPGARNINLHHAGWHFGWLGDEEFAKTKIKSFSHQEINRADILDNIDIDRHIAEGRDHFRPENVTWHTVDMDEYFPKTILNNREKYEQFILPDSGKIVRDFWPNEILEWEAV